MREGLLFNYVKHGDKSRINKVDEFTKEEVNKKNEKGKTPLIVAVESSRYEIVKELI